MKVGQALRAVSYRLAVQYKSAGSPRNAAVMATNSADQSRPFLDQSRTWSPSLRAMIRKPSCFSSCSQPSPFGTRSERTGWQGGMKPGGTRRRHVAVQMLLGFGPYAQGPALCRMVVVRRPDGGYYIA